MNNTEIPYVVNYNNETYYPDYLTWLKYHKKKDWLFIISGFLFSAVYFLLTDAPIAFGLLIFSSVFLLFEIYNISKQINNIKKTQERFIYGKENLIIKPTSFKFTYRHKYDELFFSQITRVLDFENVLFFEIKTKGHYPFRLNKLEITNECYTKIVEVMNSNDINIHKIKS